MADETDVIVFNVVLNEKYDFMVAVSKSSSIAELRAEIPTIAREVFPCFRGGQVLNLETRKGSKLPDRYQVGTILQNESKIICCTSDHKKRKKTNLETNSCVDSEDISSSISLTEHEGLVIYKPSEEKSCEVQQESPQVTSKNGSEQKRSTKYDKQQKVISKGGNKKENSKELNQNDKQRPTKAKGKKAVPEQGNVIEQQNATKNQGNAFVTNFIADMQELESESSHDEGLLRRCGAGKCLGKTQSRACDVKGDLHPLVDQMQKLETVRNKPTVMTPKRSLPEAQRTVNHSISSETILSASEYKRLFTMSEHCQPKRKEAIEMSASKVSEWLYDIVSSVDVQHSDNGTMDIIESEFEGQSEQAVDKRTPAEAMRTEKSHDADNEHDDNDDDNDEEEEEVCNMPMTRNRANLLENKKATDVTQTCQVRIEKLPVRSVNGRLKVIARDKSGEKELSRITKESPGPRSLKKTKSPCKQLNKHSNVRVDEACGNETGLNETVEDSRKSEIGNLQAKRRVNSESSRNTSDCASEVQTCQVRIENVPFCRDSRGRFKVVQRSGHQITNRPGDDVSNASDVNNKNDVYTSSEEDSKSTSLVSETPLSDINQVDGDLELNVHEQEAVINKRKHLDIERGVGDGEKEEISQTTKQNKTPRKDTKSKEQMAQSRTQDIYNQSVKQVSANESNVASLQNKRKSAKKDPMSENKMSPSKSKNTVNSREYKTADTLLHEARHNSGDAGDKITKESPGPSPAVKKTKSPCKQLNKHSNVCVDEACGNETGLNETVEDSRKSEIGNLQAKRRVNSESSRNTSDCASEVQTCQVGNESDVASLENKRKSAKKDLISKKKMSPSKSKNTINSREDKTADTFLHEACDNSGDRGPSPALKKNKSPCKRLDNVKLSKGKHSAVHVDEAEDQTCLDVVEQSEASEEEDEREGDLTPIYLRTIKEGEQIEWMTEICRDGDSEQVAEDHQDFTKRVEKSDCKPASPDEQPRTANTSTSERIENDTENSPEDKELKNDGEENTMTKRSKRKNKKLDSWVKNANQENVSDRTMEEENVQLEIVTEDPNRKKSKQKKRRLEENEDTWVERAHRESVSNTTMQENATEDPISNKKKKKALKRKAGEGSCDKPESQASIEEQTPTRKVNKDGYCREDKQNKYYKKVKDRKTSNHMEGVNSVSDEGNQLEKEKKRKKKKKKKEKEEEKKRQSELRNTESETALASPIFERVDYSENSHNKLKRNKRCTPEKEPHVSRERKADKETTPTEQGVMLNDDPEGSKSKQYHMSNPDHTQQKSKKKSKALSLLDLALDAAAVQRTPNTVTNSKRALRQVSSAHQLARHFRRTPKGFLHSPKKRKIAASTSSIIIRRKSRTDPKENLKQVEMTPKEKDLKDLVTSRVSFEQLLDDESFWDT